jgi:hypothetical protein
MDFNDRKGVLLATVIREINHFALDLLLAMKLEHHFCRIGKIDVCRAEMDNSMPKIHDLTSPVRIVIDRFAVLASHVPLETAAF